MVYNINVKIVDDPRGRFKKGRNHRTYSEVDRYLSSVFDAMKVGQTRRVAFEIENIYSEITIPRIIGAFTLDKRENSRYERGSFQAYVLGVLYPEYADKIGVCL